MAHKKAAGSAKNLRDSNAKYRGVKLLGGQFAKAGNIIIRQKGDSYQLGEHVYKGRDFTIHASVDGTVSFSKKKFTKYNGRVYLETVVSIIPQTPVVPEGKKPARTIAGVANAGHTDQLTLDEPKTPKAKKPTTPKKELAPKTTKTAPKKETTKKEPAPKKPKTAKPSKEQKPADTPAKKGTPVKKPAPAKKATAPKKTSASAPKK